MELDEVTTAQELRWERRELALGIPAFVLFLIGLVLNGGTDLRSMTGAEVTAYFEDGEVRMVGAFLAVALAVFCLLWFLGAARARLRRGSGGAARPATTALAAGAVFVGLVLAGRAAAGAPAAIFRFGFEGAELDPVAASLFLHFAYDLWAAAGVAASIMVAALAIAGETGTTLPRWFVFSGFVTAFIGLIAIVYPWAALLIVMLWIAGASWFLARSGPLVRPDEAGDLRSAAAARR